ncbi:hypothetical protein [Pantoea agglomerans]|uniref:Uncharacterized protein n=1 Tax=Enterobacter agglomerans TaxID=549 RepID=A0ACC5RIX9_ENTAG|nr:hypothetical protein [Pantoea agglomerans]MBK4724662.1 hypothetical protein [Pantoea agglomerans]
MNTIESYTPEFVLRLKQNADPCHCPCCQRQPSTVTLRWQEQIRHSALLDCDRAAREILCREDAFILHSDRSEKPNARPLDPRLQALNQAAINLAISGDASPEQVLYTLGVLISKSSQLSEPQQIEALGDELIGLMQQGMMAQAFEQLPVIDTSKLAALKALSRCELDASLDPLTGMTLILKLNDINVMTSDYLQDTLQELEQAPQLAEFMQSHRSVFLNVLLYAFYHDVFPGENECAWQQQFYRLCQHFFSVKMLCAIFIHSEMMLDDETIAALFAAWQRAPEVAASDNPLLAGISLLR